MNWLKQLANKRQPALAPSITLNDPHGVEAIATEMDFIWIDMEHLAISPSEVSLLMMAARRHGRKSLVRVGTGAPEFVKPLMDAGANAILLSQITSADEARALVEACRYPPVGKRGFGPRVANEYGRKGGPDYVTEQNEQMVTGVMIETREALNQVEEIAAIPGLDTLCVGPYDLSGAVAELGDVEHPDNVAAIERIIAAAHAAGKPVGCGMGANPDYARTMIERGIDWIQFGNDYEFMLNGIRNALAPMRDTTGTLNAYTGEST